MSFPVEETVVVTVGIIGMAGSGTGTHTVNMDLSKPSEAVVKLYEALQKALGGAMQDVFPEFKAYTHEKYGDQEVDIEDDF